MPDTQRAKRDIAYGCFLPPGIASTVTAIGNVVPMDTGMAGGVGFLVLLPLAMMSLITIPIGITLSILCWRDGVLPVLSVLTILWVTEIVTEAGSVQFYNAATGTVYAALVFTLTGSWFLVRRWLIKPQP